jgi:hypothetical protein
VIKAHKKWRWSSNGHSIIEKRLHVERPKGLQAPTVLRRSVSANALRSSPR